MHVVVLATSGHAWATEVLGLAVVRRHALAAERAGAERVTVACKLDEANCVSELLRGTSAHVFAVTPDELALSLERFAHEGAVVLPCDRLVDSEAVRALGERAEPGRLVSAVDNGVRGCNESLIDRVKAERALCQTVFKPTDNLLARLNRRVSLPISRRLVRTHLSPNAISLIGLGISFLAGAAYAVGGYGFMLLGAFLGWFSSMWDGCDGEVARLTYRETAFGCWLESVCDDLYYVAVFVGMTIGLCRDGDLHWTLLVGGLALVGFVVMAIEHYILRARVAARTGSPQRFARFFEERMNAMADDPFARFARASWKLGTRSTLPYILFVLALLGQTRLALVLVALGAHLYWTLSLYLWWSSPLVEVSSTPE